MREDRDEADLGRAGGDGEALAAVPAAPSRTAAPARPKPAKPYADFPLFPHATRRWAKKIGGRFEFFGPWDDPYGALDRYLARRDGLFLAAARSKGRGQAPAVGTVGPQAPTSPPTPALGPAGAHVGTRGERGADVRGPAVGVGDEGLGPIGTVTVRELVNQFLTAKQRRVDAKEMGLRSFGDYHSACRRMVKVLGASASVDHLSTGDFARLRASIAKTKGPVALTNELGRVRSVFKYALDAGLVDRPVRFGPEFAPPPRKAMREARRERGLKLFEPDEVAALLKAASPAMRAMVLLGVNAGFGNSDLAALHRAAVDLGAGVIDFPRPKTGISRRAILWPETVEALRHVINGAAPRAGPGPGAGATDLVFRTPRGHALVRADAPQRVNARGAVSVVRDAVALAFHKLARTAGVAQPGRGFYALRHTFRTIADELPDRRAIDRIMGHEDSKDIANHYVERIADERLRAVSEHVRKRVMGAAGA